MALREIAVQIALEAAKGRIFQKRVFGAQNRGLGQFLLLNHVLMAKITLGYVFGRKIKILNFSIFWCPGFISVIFHSIFYSIFIEPSELLFGRFDKNTIENTPKRNQGSKNSKFSKSSIFDQKRILG